MSTIFIPFLHYKARLFLLTLDEGLESLCEYLRNS
jgi:hypothetical protein